jgi:hypothetical protein
MNDQPPAAKPSKPPIKAIVLVVLMLIVEAGLLIGAMIVFGGPSEVQGVTVQGADDPQHQTVEIPLLHERFSNLSRGVSMVYDTELLLVVPTEHAGTVEAMLEAKRGQIRAGVSRIWRSAEASYFNEPGYETLSRQVEDLLNRLFESQPKEGRYIEQVLIPKCMGFRNDF